MFRTSKDSPAFYLTSVSKDRLPVFRTDTLADITCKALNEARTSGKFLIFAYVVMPDHLHLVTDYGRSSKDIHRFVNGIISRRVIDHLKETASVSLRKLQILEQANNYKYSLWQHHPDTRLLWNDKMLMQRINYTHLNPVRAGLVNHPDDWRWSSARIWNKRPLPEEPLEVNIDQIDWRR